MQPAKTQAAATSHSIRKILGPVDDETVMDIIQTGATAGEVAEAFEWLNDDDYMSATLKKRSVSACAVFMISCKPTATTSRLMSAEGGSA